MNGHQDYGRCSALHFLFGLLSKCRRMVQVGYSEFYFLVAAMISVKPLQAWVWGEGSAQSAVENKLVSHVEFKQVKSEAELQQALAENNKSLGDARSLCGLVCGL